MRIYSKLYLSFLLIFIVTLFVVSLLTSRFYTSRVREEVESYLLAQARYLQGQYQENCDGSMNSPKCALFLRRVSEMQRLRVWVLNPDGAIVLSREHSTPEIESDDIRRSAQGQTVISSFRRRGAPYVILPLGDSEGHIHHMFVMQRSFLRGDRFPRQPIIPSIMIAGGVIALLVLPLSHLLTRPTRQLYRLGQEWSEGRLESRASFHGNDEISELGQTFNIMAENLQKSLQQKKEFLALISHELKSPLARMNIALELLLQNLSTDPNSQKLIHGIQADITESGKLVEQLLVLSRLEMNLPQMSMQQIDLAELLKRTVDQILPVAAAARVSIRTDNCNLSSPVVYADADQLQRAVMNVLENSIKFSPSGSQVQMNCRQSDGAVTVEFVDQGLGVAQEEYEKIFEPFYRSKQAHDKQGSGLGLFLTRKIIERHNGKISARANPAGGTIVTIELPEAKPSPA